ncbi:hypothetical protein NDU88_001874 [Pleurodeles waltl]|uniref:Uncharacterized protein n=1 Tax=Pleurodeles waltl TaxID=8319 RepID=A0AAV7P6R8_PLEWA|nr:hypothetical protein NDU88_001874 [Pleurodeles waltl]
MPPIVRDKKVQRELQLQRRPEEKPAEMPRGPATFQEGHGFGSGQVGPRPCVERGLDWGGARASLRCLRPQPLQLKRGLCGPVGNGGGTSWVPCGP